MTGMCRGVWRKICKTEGFFVVAVDAWGCWNRWCSEISGCGEQPVRELVDAFVAEVDLTIPLDLNIDILLQSLRNFGEVRQEDHLA